MYNFVSKGLLKAVHLIILTLLMPHRWDLLFLLIEIYLFSFYPYVAQTIKRSVFCVKPSIRLALSVYSGDFGLSFCYLGDPHVSVGLEDDRYNKGRSNVVTYRQGFSCEWCETKVKDKVSVLEKSKFLNLEHCLYLYF